ncbi:SMC-Scp complex subunit ScpB [Candidatus Woesearchaeota archaeon]|nr:SMC-Scp complex subunit ScpB [Candidatus Woesearchaeota archaeon]
MEDLKKKVEAVLFSVGKKIELADIAKLCREKDIELVRNALGQLMHEYENKDSSLMIVEEGTKWKLTVREKYTSIVKKIVADTELSKTILETLAVVAWKNPVLQSDVIKIRTNKAYDHLDQLEEMGFIARQKHSRTKMIKLTEKFFNYFDLEGDGDIKKVFARVKEGEVKGKPEEKKPELDGMAVVDEKVRYDDTEKLGSLEVYDEPKENLQEESKETEEQPEPSAENTETPEEEESAVKEESKEEELTEEPETGEEIKEEEPKKEEKEDILQENIEDDVLDEEDKKELEHEKKEEDEDDSAAQMP